MHYELSAGLAAGAEPGSRERGPARVCEQRSSYRRNWYAERDDRQGAHEVTVQAERRVRRGAGRARFRRMLELSQRLSAAALPEPARSDFLELEETLHEHWLAIAIEHYNLGVEAGLLEAALNADAARELAPRERLRALADALRKAIDEL